MFTSALAEYITLWKGVVGETIGAVTAPSHLTYGIETGERCSPPGIRTHTTAEKVGFWAHQELCSTIIELLYIDNAARQSAASYDPIAAFFHKHLAFARAEAAMAK